MFIIIVLLTNVLGTFVSIFCFFISHFWKGILIASTRVCQVYYLNNMDKIEIRSSYVVAQLIKISRLLGQTT